MDINASPASIIYQNLKKEFEKGIVEAKPSSDQLVTKVPSSASSNVYPWLSHVPGMREWFQYQPRVLRNVESKDFTVPNRKFEDTIQISVDEVNDNQAGSYGGIAKAMGIQGTLLQDQLVFGEALKNGFTTTLCYDGLSWFNDNHKVGLSTVDNNLGALALSDANLETAITRLRSFTVKPDKLSEPRPLNPGGEKLVLVVPPTLEMTARKIVSVATVATGGENHLYHAAEILVSSWLTDANDWFLLNIGGAVKPLFFQEREKLHFRQLGPNDGGQEFHLDTYTYGCKVRCAVCASFPWLACGSTGA
jgi:phage major head subunit gpT-like protein